MQTELDSEGTGLKINIDKTKVLRLSVRRHLEDRIKLNSTDVEDTDSFVYLGPLVTTWVALKRTSGVGWVKLCFSSTFKGAENM